MKQIKFLFIFLVNLFLISFVSAYDFFYYTSPSMLLENEWVVFGGIFLVVFALVYIALLGSLGKSVAGENKSKGGVIVISFVVALFSASALTQRALFSGYLGDTILGWVTIGAFVLFILLLIPLGKKLADSRYPFPIYVGVPVLVGWFILKFFEQQAGFSVFELFESYGLYVVSDFVNFFLLDKVFWIVLIIIAIGLWFGRKKRKGSGLKVTLED